MLLAQVDHQQYVTPASFLADAHLIVRCAEELYGEPEVAATAAAANPAAANPAAAGGADAAVADGQAAAADGGGGGLPVLTRSLPAVRVAVCKEISRAMELRVRGSTGAVNKSDRFFSHRIRHQSANGVWLAG
jgi:hypothetical protein